MSADQRASVKVKDIVSNVLELLVKLNKNWKELRELGKLGMDLGQLLAPHSLLSWECIVPQEKVFLEGWKLFVSCLEGADPATVEVGPQEVALEAAVVEPAYAPLPVVADPVSEETVPVIQVEASPEPVLEPSVHRPSAPPAPTPVVIKEETEKSQHIPPAGSVENPMTIDESDDDAVVIQSPIVTAKRKMKVPPPGGENPGKRPKPTQTILPFKTADSSEELPSSVDYKWKPHKDAKVEIYGKNQKLLHARLDQLGSPFDVDRSRLTHDKFIITRADITSIYGGECVASFPKMGKKARATHGYRNFIHGNFDHNPFFPPEPGWPGLLFRLDELNDHQDMDGNPIVYRTFARHADRRCVYLGQYTFTKLEDISGTEWRKLPEKTQTIWLKFFGETLLANRTLARIALRISNDEEPTEAQVTTKCEFLKAPEKRISLANKMETEIRRAFNCGDEGIIVWGMKCVSYDYEFENNLATKWQELDHSTRRTKSDGLRGRKIPGSDSDIPDDEYEEDGEEDEALTSRSRAHFPRKAKCGKRSTCIPRGDIISENSGDSDSEELDTDSEEDFWYMERQSRLDI